MNQTGIPFVFMRGGTSRGPYFDRQNLPEDEALLAQVLISALGAGHPWNIDGIGGGTAVTTKVAMLSKAADEWADIDYFFAQVAVEEKSVDFKPSCGNILSGVAPAAIELGLLTPTSDVTEVRINAVNTGARVVATIQTPDGVSYAGDTQIAGVPGSGSPITLQFLDTVGGVCGSFLPTGQLLDVIDDVPVTCMDVAMPLVIARAQSFGLSGYETAEELDGNEEFMSRMESIRRNAGAAMGMGDVSQSVTPKFGLLAPAREGGTVCARYFMPWKCHPSMAVTGAQCIAACVLAPGTVADGLCPTKLNSPATVTIEHASGAIDVLVNFTNDANGFTPISAGLVRTARKLVDGNLYIPSDVWSG